MKLLDNLEHPMIHQIRLFVESFRKRKLQIFLSLVFLTGSFFLSQAVLFDAAVPFFLPVWALARARFKKQSIWVFVGGMAGSVFLGFGQAIIHLLQLLLFNLVIKYPLARKSVPATVVVCMLAIQTVWQFIMHGARLPFEIQVFLGFEAIFALLMTIFLFLAFPSVDRIFLRQWTMERLGAACIIGALLLTGMNGIMIGHVSIAGVLIYLTIFLTAIAGGIPFSTSIAMIFAAILGISELSFTSMMAVYGMTGFFTGALRRFGKIGVATGGFAVSLFFFMYDLTLPLDSTHFVTISAATILFFLVPTKYTQRLRQLFIPENVEVSKKRQQWLSNRLDEQLADFQQFADFMSTLIGGGYAENKVIHNQQEKQTPDICQSCFRYSKCWASNDDSMNHLLQDWHSNYATTKKSTKHHIEEQIKYKCIRFNGLIAELEEQAASRLLSGQLQHGRKMLALQLRDMSRHLDKMMKEVKEDISIYRPAEEELAKRLEAKAVEFFQIDILSGKRGECRIVCCIPEKRSDFETDTTVAERLILPIVEEMYEEPFQIISSVVNQTPFPHIRLTVGSAVRFGLEYGVVSTSGTDSFTSGDAYEVFPIHDGLTAVLLSDGMGQDIYAYRESQKVIRLMRECLDRKMEPETAMHTLHYMMSLNGLDDMYATLDLALIDLQDGRLWSWKAGSMSTYIKRGDDFLRVDSQSVPVGFLPFFSIESKKEDLKSGDILVMMTDGIFNGEYPLEQQEKALYGTLRKHEENDCETIAERIINEMARRFRAETDDRTVLVMKIEHAIPEWSSFTPYSKRYLQYK